MTEVYNNLDFILTEYDCFDWYSYLNVQRYFMNTVDIIYWRFFRYRSTHTKNAKNKYITHWWYNVSNTLLAMCVDTTFTSPPTDYSLMLEVLMLRSNKAFKIQFIFSKIILWPIRYNSSEFKKASPFCYPFVRPKLINEKLNRPL